MSAPTGHQKWGGRQKGTPNKKTLILNEALDSIGFDLVGKLNDIIPQLDIKDQAYVLLALMEYIYPKRKAIEFTGELDLETTMVTFAQAMKIKHELKNGQDN